MKTQRSREIRIAVLLVVVAVVIYTARVLIFGHRDEMLRYLMDDVAFLLIEALILWLVIDRVIRRIETESMNHKLNMVIGAFFAEVGNTLMGVIASFDIEFDEIRPALLVKPSWTVEDYARAKTALRGFDFSVELECGDLPALKTLLLSERPFLLGLLENQNLLEHETFTDLLWAVFHLAEELAVRPDVSCLIGADAHHVAIDVGRAYELLILEWLDYIRHLQTQYPHLFSLAVRTNPLDPHATAVVAE
jgi:hypothetical protein